MAKRIKVNYRGGDAAYYVHLWNGQWQCSKADGTQVLFREIMRCADEMALKFSLEDAGSDFDRLTLIRRRLDDRSEAGFFEAGQFPKPTTAD